MNDLDTLLGRDAAQPVPDLGFTRRVLDALPPPRSAPSWLRPVLVLGSAVVGSGLAAAFAPRMESPSMAIAEWMSNGVVSPAAITALAIGGALLLSGLVIAFDSE